MKKYLLNLAVLMMGAMMFTACSDDDDIPVTPEQEKVSNGMFVVCSGNSSNAIDGSLTYFNYSTNTSTLDFFKTVNERSLGTTANDMIVYGSKAYIIVSGSNTVEVADAASMKSIKQISTTKMLGDAKGKTPRCVTGDGGFVYFSTYGKVVAVIDTISYSLQKTYEAGSYPEGIAVANGYLYVANSDYGKVNNASISKINLETGTSQTITDKTITNPNKIAVVDNNIYYLDYGTYDPSTYDQMNAGIRKITADGKVTSLFDATAMACDGKRIYTFNNPYRQKPIPVSYSIYDIATGKNTDLKLEGIDSPATIGADPVNGYIFVTSYQMNGGYADYKANGYVNQYDASGKLIKSKIPCGVGPQSITFYVSHKK